VTLPSRLHIPDFDEWGLTAFTTARDAGTFGTAGDEPVAQVLSRWNALRAAAAAAGCPRFATATQVHGDAVVLHTDGWRGWLRCDTADGHAWPARGTAAAVTIADCVPVFMAHPSGAAAVLHSGWRGTAAGIAGQAVEVFHRLGFGASSLRVHLGPAICGACYEVSPDVYAQVTGSTVLVPALLDLRSVIADRLRALGVRDIAISEWCTRCSNDRLFSHRAGDTGRQLGVFLSPLAAA
jgi:polyphenol oxidase